MAVLCGQDILNLTGPGVNKTTHGTEYSTQMHGGQINACQRRLFVNLNHAKSGQYYEVVILFLEHLKLYSFYRSTYTYQQKHLKWWR